MKQILRFCEPLHQALSMSGIQIQWKMLPDNSDKATQQTLKRLENQLCEAVREFGSRIGWPNGCKSWSSTLNPSGILPLPVTWLRNSTSSEKKTLMGYFGHKAREKQEKTLRIFSYFLPGDLVDADSQRYVFFLKDFKTVFLSHKVWEVQPFFVTQMPS